MLHLQKGAASPRLSSTVLLLSAILFSTFIHGQSLYLSSGGQTGTSGTNWTTSGTNPVTINASGSANINTSVITGYLNSGISVIVNNSSVGTVVNSDISKTGGASATLTIKDVGNVKVAANISSVSNALDLILWADTDNSQGGAVEDYMFVTAGVTISTNGGKIIMAGGPDNGTNGGTSGDGIPDGFAWNGSNSSNYGANTVGGLTLGPLSGTGTLVSILSGGGEIIMRGATSNNNTYPGIGSQANLKIVSGTGKITMYGKSTSGHGIELTYGATPNVAISSASTSTPAIDIKGTTTASGLFGFWASNNGSGNFFVQSSAATGGGISIEGVSSLSYGIIFGVSGTSMITQLLSQSGTISLKGDGSSNSSLFMYGDVWLGNRKDANAVQGITPSVTASTANILIQADDQYTLSNTGGKTVNINSTGSLGIEAYTAGYGGTLSWTGNLALGSSFSSITLGESAENYSIAVYNSLNSTGAITAYTSDFTLGNGVGLVSSGAGNITINCKGSFNTINNARRTISSVNGNINIYADSDASGNGTLDIDYTTFNAGTGTLTLRTESVNWTISSSTDKPYINGTGAFVFEPADASFGATSTSWFYFDQDANGISGITIGKSSNTGNITHENTALTVAGAINLYGGQVILNANLTSSATGDIFIKSNSNLNGAASIAGNAAIYKTAGTGTLTMQSQDRLNSGTITASGTGQLNVILWSDYDNNNNGGVAINSITTNGGHLWLGGSNSNGGSYTWNGLTVGDGPSVGSVNNNYNAIDFYGPVSTSGGDVLVWAGDGYSSGAFGLGVYAGAAINAGSGDITLIADYISFNDLTLTCTGVLSLLPYGGSYPAAVTWSGSLSGGNFNATGTFDALIINNFANLGGLVIGYYNGQLSSGTPVVQDNSSSLTISNAIGIAGSIYLYAPAQTISQNLSSTGAGSIHISANTVSIGSVTFSSTGALLIEPITAATTIGLSGGAGTLSLPATCFTSVFSNGFSQMTIGNSSAGNITLGAALTLLDPLQLITGGNLILNDIMTIGANDFIFTGGSIAPATGKYVRSNGTGKLKMTIGNSASKLFPLGTSYYNPVTITNNTGASDLFYATVSDGVYYNGAVTGTLTIGAPRVNLTWNIGNTGASTGAGNVTLAFGWVPANNVTGTLTAPKLMHYNGSKWEMLAGSPTFNLVTGTLSYTSYTGSFSPFAIGETSFTLPVNWLSFTGTEQGKTVLLQWATASESNNDHYEIERSANGTSYQSIGQLAASANPSVRNDYQFTDLNPLSGTAYYRLKQVDKDGRFRYSTVIAVNYTGTGGFELRIMPGSGLVSLVVPSTIEGRMDLFIYDAQGRQLQRQAVVAGQQTIALKSGSANNVYLIKVVKEGRTLYTGRFML